MDFSEVWLEGLTGEGLWSSLGGSDPGMRVATPSFEIRPFAVGVSLSVLQGNFHIQGV